MSKLLQLLEDGEFDDALQEASSPACNVHARGGNQQTALHEAALEGQEAIVRRLLERGATVNAVDADDMTPLHGAARRGHLHICDILLGAGANPNPKNSDELTPLHFAAQRGLEAVVRDLVARGADFRARDVFQNTPLHYAASEDRVSAIEVLAKCGAPVDAQNDRGSTPLHLAAVKGKTAACKALLDAGATRTLTNQAGLMPVDQARAKRWAECAETLESYVAKSKTTQATNVPERVVRAVPPPAPAADFSTSAPSPTAVPELPPSAGDRTQRKWVTLNQICVCLVVLALVGLPFLLLIPHKIKNSVFPGQTDFIPEAICSAYFEKVEFKCPKILADANPSCVFNIAPGINFPVSRKTRTSISGTGSVNMTEGSSVFLWEGPLYSTSRNPPAAHSAAQTSLHIKIEAEKGVSIYAATLQETRSTTIPNPRKPKMYLIGETTGNSDGSAKLNKFEILAYEDAIFKVFAMMTSSPSQKQTIHYDIAPVDKYHVLANAAHAKTCNLRPGQSCTVSLDISRGFYFWNVALSPKLPLNTLDPSVPGPYSVVVRTTSSWLAILIVVHAVALGIVSFLVVTLGRANAEQEGNVLFFALALAVLLLYASTIEVVQIATLSDYIRDSTDSRVVFTILVVTAALFPAFCVLRLVLDFANEKAQALLGNPDAPPVQAEALIPRKTKFYAFVLGLLWPLLPLFYLIQVVRELFSVVVRGNTPGSREESMTSFLDLASVAMAHSDSPVTRVIVGVFSRRNAQSIAPGAVSSSPSEPRGPPPRGGLHFALVLLPATLLTLVFSYFYLYSVVIRGQSSSLSSTSTFVLGLMLIRSGAGVAMAVIWYYSAVMPTDPSLFAQGAAWLFSGAFFFVFFIAHLCVGRRVTPTI
eukprot:TRINITY_DN4754_c0_g1_i1.p1 TRINITY_DN4754_c0_g1~~TRINITY_DN4754_c0_g1_i1.p1  ORF type:complete len:875 (+),score=217.57 TRINITY_DN4754_c0_g1_i1:3-2627(+)